MNKNVKILASFNKKNKRCGSPFTANRTFAPGFRFLCAPSGVPYRLTLHLQPPFPLLPDVGEGEAPRLLVELHRLVLLHAARRFHPFHIQRLPVVEVRHLPVAELFPRQAFHQAVQRVDAVLVMHALRHELRVILHYVRVQRLRH